MLSADHLLYIVIKAYITYVLRYISAYNTIGIIILKELYLYTQ